MCAVTRLLQVLTTEENPGETSSLNERKVRFWPFKCLTNRCAHQGFLRLDSSTRSPSPGFRDSKLRISCSTSLYEFYADFTTLFSVLVEVDVWALNAAV